MLVNFKETEYCKIEAHYEADPDLVKNKKQEIISKLRGRKISGFRKGKASDQAIEVHLKKEIEHHLKNELAVKAFDDILFETKIKNIGYPQYSSLFLKNNKFTCDVSFLKRPEFELKEYQDLEVPKPHLSKTVEQLTETILQDLRQKNSELTPFEENDFAQMHDQLTLDFEMTDNGVPFEGSSGEGVLYTVGEHSFEEFDENILGIKPGETREFDVNIITPEGNKKAHAKVTCHMGVRKTPSALDNELAVKVGLNNIEELVNKASGMAASYYQQMQESEIINQISKKLIQINEINIPSFLTSSEVNSMLTQQNIKLTDLSDEQRENIKNKAVDNVKLALILETIREKEPEATLGDSECVNLLQQKINSLGQNSNEILAEMQKNGSILLMIASLKNEFTLKWIASKAKIVE